MTDTAILDPATLNPAAFTPAVPPLSPPVPKPAHIPDALVYDFDLYSDPDLIADPHSRILDLIESAPPIFWTPRRDGHWMVMSHEGVFAIARDTEAFSNSFIPQEDVHKIIEARAAGAGGYPMPVPIMLDPPAHGKYRKPLQATFSPKTVNALRDTIRSLARSLVGKVSDQGECEFMSAVAEPLPVSVFLKMFGLPVERQAEYRALVKEHLATPTFDPDRAGAKRQRLADALREPMLECQRVPKDDIISMLWQTQINGRATALPDMENFGILLFIAGLDTVLNGIGHGIRHLALDQDLQARLRAEPQLIGDAVEELLRLFGFATPPPRRVVRDMVFQGIEFREGEIVDLFLAGANLDPSVFEQPEKFDLNRKNKVHIAFNAGPHRCLGSHLARLEMRTCYEEVLAGLPQFKLDPAKPPTFHGGHVIGVDTLHLKWEP